MSRLTLHHVERMSSAPEIMKFARRINKIFLKEGKTDMKHLDSEYEAVYMRDVETDVIAAIIVFGLIDDEDRRHRTYYVPIVFVSPKYRGQKCYPTMLDWLLVYAKAKGAATVETDVMSWNTRMVEVCMEHWEQTYLRFKIRLSQKESS